MSIVGKKRERDDADITQKPKKIKFDNGEPVKPAVSKLVAEEIDFPRGGGTALTPLEYKNIRAEAVKEADAELVFEVRTLSIDGLACILISPLEF